MPLPALAVPLISAAASIGGSLLTNRANAREAQRNRDFQERMSSTALTRARNDMLNAGINPNQLAAGAGGASTPGGAVAQVENPLAGGISNARESALAREQLNLMKAQVEKTDAERSKTAIEGANAQIVQDTLREQQKQAIQATKQAEITTKYFPQMVPAQLQQTLIQNALQGLMIPGAQNEAKLQKKLGIGGAAIPFILNSAKGAKAILK